MAEDLDDGEFWLPSQFLADDDILMDFAGNTNKSSQEKDGFHWLGRKASGSWSFGVSSDQSSPGGQSMAGSTEAESDEDEYFAELTRVMARSTLEDCTANSNGWILSGSPQSTLCAVGGGCHCNQGSRRGKPNDPVSPPPVAGVKGGNQNDAALDLLHAAAGEVDRLRIRIEQQGTGFFDGSNRALLYPIKKPTTHIAPVPLKSTATSSNPSARYYRQLQASQQFNYHKQQQQLVKKMKEQQGVWGQVRSIGSQQQNRTTVNGVARNSNRQDHQPQPQVLSLSDFPPLQHPNQQQHQNQRRHGGGTGMRAVFLDTSPVTKRECAGTGVFLPRRFGSQTDLRKKPACSTVLTSAKVVQALNNMEPHSHYSPRIKGNLSSDLDGVKGFGSTAGFLSSQRRSSNSGSQAANSHEIQLPQEWIY